MGTPRTTVERILVAGECGAAGADSVYHKLRAAQGEGWRPRTDFVTDNLSRRPGGRHVLLTLAHLTDLHVVDAQSPARLDFAMRLGANTASWGGLVNYTFRPQEVLGAHAVAAMAETLSRLPVDLAVVTGDSADNTQANEVAAYLAALDGGVVHPVSGGDRYTGIQTVEWDDDWYWRPETGLDQYKRRWGFPTVPELLDAASRPFTSRGLGVPWITCLGNHDLLVGGTAPANDALRAIAVGGWKATEVPHDVDLSDALGTYIRHPEQLFSGKGRDILPDPGRRLLTPRDFIEAHFGGGTVPGHGFTERNRADGTGYYAYDAAPGVRIVALDTNHRLGHWDGSIDQAQLQWLDDELSRLDGPDGPLVILASHHATPSLNNSYGVCADHEASVAYSRELLAVALRHPNVVLWLNGHHHANRVAAHYRASGGGLFEVTTASITDWPCQARVIEVAIEADGRICLTSTMVDHDGDLVPAGRPEGTAWLAGMHRELAANECFRGGRQGLGGTPDDRNVRMYLPAR